jgi:hypothetical protein
MNRPPDQPAPHRSKRSAYGMDTDCHRVMKRARWLQNQIVEPEAASWARYAGRSIQQAQWKLHYGQASLMGDCFKHRPEESMTSMLHGKVKVLRKIQLSLRQALSSISEEQRCAHLSWRACADSQPGARSSQMRCCKLGCSAAGACACASSSGVSGR